MQRLLSQLDEHGQPRYLYAVSIGSLAEWRAALGTRGWPVLSGEGFALLLAGDGRTMDAEELGALAEWCHDADVFTVSTWGEDCERVHDVFDEAEVMLEIDRHPETMWDGPVVMTNWLADQPFTEALSFFWEWSTLDEGKPGGPARIVLLVGDPSLSGAVDLWVAAGGP